MALLRKLKDDLVLLAILAANLYREIPESIYLNFARRLTTFTSKANFVNKAPRFSLSRSSTMQSYQFETAH